MFKKHMLFVMACMPIFIKGMTAEEISEVAQKPEVRQRVLRTLTPAEMSSFSHTLTRKHIQEMDSFERFVEYIHNTSEQDRQNSPFYKFAADNQTVKGLVIQQLTIEELKNNPIYKPVKDEAKNELINLIQHLPFHHLAELHATKSLSTKKEQISPSPDWPLFDQAAKDSIVIEKVANSSPFPNAGRILDRQWCSSKEGNNYSFSFINIHGDQQTITTTPKNIEKLSKAMEIVREVERETRSLPPQTSVPLDNLPSLNRKKSWKKRYGYTLGLFATFGAGIGVKALFDWWGKI